VNSSEFIDSVLCANPSFEHIFSIFHSIVDFVSETCDDISNTILLIMILFPICNIFLGVFSINAQNQNGEMARNVLMPLPKSDVFVALTEFKIKNKESLTSKPRFYCLTRKLPQS
jgi:hypothetical protein